MSRKISKDDIQKQLNTYSLTEIISMLNTYSASTSTDVSAVKKSLIINDFQNRLVNNNINTDCPYCKGKNIVGFGKNGNIKRFKCKACSKTFTLFTNTILEKTKYHWDIWIAVLSMVLNNIPVEHIVETLHKDYKLLELDYKTVFLWKHKIIHALASMPLPRLSGVIQIDETFFRESQKGSRELVSFVKGENRTPRYGRVSSNYGVMGNEYANVVCMVDLKGFCVSKVIGLGKLTKEVFTDMFDSYIDNPSFICADGNFVYKNYCELKNIPLYIKPSNYLKTITDNGYETPDWSSTTLAAKQEEENQKILEKLYYKRQIDYIVGRDDLSYKEFYELKNANSLSLARVNQFHGELKRFLVCNPKGVSTKYLEDYIGFYTYLRNWKVSNGHYPSSLTDAESIFIDILKGKTNYTNKDLKEAEITLPKASDKYMTLLKEKTERMRTLTKNPYFKYDEEDNVVSFNKRKFLEDIPLYKLNELCKKYRIPSKYVKYSKISELLTKPHIDDDILLLISEHRHYDISEEDLEVIKSKKYSH